MLGRGQRQVNRAACKKSWTYPRNPLNLWIEAIKSGGMPNFGANLAY
jgi:hypothetical protein